MLSFILNDQLIQTQLPNGSLLLDFIRYQQGLSGTKIGCWEGDCGACTVLIGELNGDRVRYRQITSCLTPLGNAHGRHVVTIEGLNMAQLSPVQDLLVDEGASQCGFCTVGFVQSLTAFCLSEDAPTYQKAIAAIDGNICRCTGYKSIERAALRLSEGLSEKNNENPLTWLIDQGYLPVYFQDIPQRLSALQPATIPANSEIVVGGGTDLYVQRPEELQTQEVLLTADQNAWRYVRMVEGFCELGGATTVTDLLESAEFCDLFPRLPEHMKLISSTPIRNMSSVAGNFVNASPIGDLTAFFLALETDLILSNGMQERSLPLRQFYLGYKQLNKKEEERITAIRFPIPAANSHFNLEKVCKRIHLDIASVNTAAQIRVESGRILQVHISAGGVGPTPLYLTKTSEFLSGKPLSAATVTTAWELMQTEISPISDVRGSADYKRLLLRQLFYAHFIQLFPESINLASLR